MTDISLWTRGCVVLTRWLVERFLFIVNLSVDTLFILIFYVGRRGGRWRYNEPLNTAYSRLSDLSSYSTRVNLSIRIKSARLK